MTTTTAATRILVVEEDTATGLILAKQLKAFGYEVCGIADTVETAIEAADSTAPQLVLMSVGLANGGDGIVAAQTILERHTIPVVFVTACYDEETLTRVLAISPTGYLIKPFRPSELKVSLDLALHRHGIETQARHERRVLEELAMTDPLTGLANRRHLEQRLQLEWARAARDHSSLAVLIVDIDGFKSMNDTYGHAAGDACLKRVGHLLGQLSTRGSGIFGRWGGDEFMVILPGTSQEGLRFIADNIVTMSREAPDEALAIPITLSVGGSLVDSPTPAADWKPLVAEADRRLYAAKALGRDRADCGSDGESLGGVSPPARFKTQLTLAVSPSLRDQLGVLHRQINRNVPVIDQICVAIYEPATGRLSTALQIAEDGGMLSSYSAILANVPSLMALVESRLPRVINDVRSETSGRSPHSQFLQVMQYRSSYTIPIFVHDDFVGFVFLDSHRPAAFTDDFLAAWNGHLNMIQMLICQEMFVVRALHGTSHAVRHAAHFGDVETSHHLQRMARYSRVIAAELTAQRALSDEFVDLTFLFAPFHDIGKLGVARSVLLKPNSLTTTEQESMAAHVDLGSRIVEMLIDEYKLSQFSGIRVLRNIVSGHHEMLDGSGYPRGLKGDQIPLETRIVTVADIFDALTSRRPYKEPWSMQRAFAELRKMVSAGKLDADCVAALVTHQFSASQILKDVDKTSR
jgi:diguanylate cyclase (GGDEF)-like protein